MNDWTFGPHNYERTPRVYIYIYILNYVCYIKIGDKLDFNNLNFF